VWGELLATANNPDGIRACLEYAKQAVQQERVFPITDG